jgi:DNA-binding transcriptional LysR family regulator
LWRFVDRSRAGSRTISIPVRPRIALNGAGAAIDAAVRGSGICQALSYQVADHVVAGRLIPLLAPFEPSPIPVHLVFHPVPRRNAVLRAFIDYAAPQLRTALIAVGAQIPPRKHRSAGGDRPPG